MTSVSKQPQAQAAGHGVIDRPRRQPPVEASARAFGLSPSNPLRALALAVARMKAFDMAFNLIIVANSIVLGEYISMLLTRNLRHRLTGVGLGLQASYDRRS